MSVRMLGRGRTSDHSDTDISDQEMDTARTALSVSPYKDSGYRWATLLYNTRTHFGLKRSL